MISMLLDWLKRLPRLMWDSLRLGGSGLLGALLLGVVMVLFLVLFLVVLLPVVGLLRAVVVILGELADLGRMVEGPQPVAVT